MDERDLSHNPQKKVKKDIGENKNALSPLKPDGRTANEVEDGVVKAGENSRPKNKVEEEEKMSEKKAGERIQEEKALDCSHLIDISTKAWHNSFHLHLGIDQGSALVIKISEKDQLNIKTLCSKPSSYRKHHSIKKRASSPTSLKSPQPFDSVEYQLTNLCAQVNGTRFFEAFLEVGSNSGIPNFTLEQRIRYEKTDTFPYSVHGLVGVWLETEEKYQFGTGILIGLNLVLTAAHNIRDKVTGKKYSRIEFIPGLNESNKPFGRIGVEESYVPEQFLENGIDEDYGLLVLSKPIGKETGYFGLNIAGKDLLKDKILYLIGYPGFVRTKDEKHELTNLSKEGSHQLWGMSGKARFSEQDEGNGKSMIIYQKILTSGGQSGSGVFYHDVPADEYYVVGVHIISDECERSATWITKERFEVIKNWIKESKQKPIQKRIHEVQEGELRKKKFLNLSEVNLDDEDLLFLVERYPIPALEILDLGENELSSTSIKVCAAKLDWLNLLKQLNLSNNNLGDEGARGLSENKSWTKLETLELRSNQIGKEGAEALSKNSTWMNLQDLDLSNNKIGDEGAIALSKTNSWPNLAILGLEGNSIGKEGAIALSKSTAWPNLTTLDLGRNDIGSEGAITLSKTIAWPNLTSLDLQKNSIGPDGAMALSTTTAWSNLTSLNLDECSIGDVGAIALSKTIAWPNLKSLDLQNNSIGQEGAIALCKNTAWPNLTTFALSFNDIGDVGAMALSKSIAWHNLAELDIQYNSIADRGAVEKALKNRWPALSLKLI